MTALPKSLGSVAEVDEALAALAPPPMRVSAETLSDRRVPLRERDYCAHMYLPLQECMWKTKYVPWACGAEKHHYEQCQFVDYKRRMKVAALQRRRNELEARDSSTAAM